MQSTFLSSLIGDLNMLTAEQLLAAQKANLATLFDLGQKAFEGVEKVMELNLTREKVTKRMELVLPKKIVIKRMK